MNFLRYSLLAILILAHAAAFAAAPAKEKTSKKKAAPSRTAKPTPTATPEADEKPQSVKSAAKMRERVTSIMQDIELLRERLFKDSIKVENQSKEDFGKYVDHQLDVQMPGSKFKDYGKVIKKLGLYNGEEIKDFRGMARLLITSQAAAYYDPETNKFYVLFQRMSDLMMGTLYAHELTHGLQDQTYDLDKYMMEPQDKTAPGAKLNDDEILARQSVVEGEATYVMTLWQTMKGTGGKVPSRSMVEPMVRMQSDLDLETIRGLLKGGSSEARPDDLQESIDAMDDIPRFMLEMMMGAYMKGMYFVFTLQKDGWDKVDQLFTNPPASSEQIMHPEKYIAGEKPFRIKWASFKDEPLFKDWDLLEDNTLGELGFRMIFTEFKMGPLTTKEAAKGWDGDSYAVLKNKKTDELLLLLYTSWDTDEDATEFEVIYEKLLKVKYPKKEEVVDLGKIGKDVLIIEGGNDKMAAGLREFMSKATKSKPPSPTPAQSPTPAE